MRTTAGRLQGLKAERPKKGTNAHLDEVPGIGARVLDLQLKGREELQGHVVPRIHVDFPEALGVVWVASRMVR